MIRILLSGCGGRMGKAVQAFCAQTDEFSVVAGVDPAMPTLSFPVYASFDKVDVEADVIVDFSFHTGINDLLSYAV